MIRHLAMAACAAQLLAAGCGGGGGGDVPVIPTSVVAVAAQGLWHGTTAKGQEVTGLVFRDGSYYLMFGQVDNPFRLWAVLQGSGIADANSSTFSSTDALGQHNMGASLKSPASVTGSFVSGKTFNATIQYSADDVANLSFTYDAEFDTVPMLWRLQGSYFGTAQLPGDNGPLASLEIGSQGAISGLSSLCQIRGTATPQSEGNAYLIRINFSDFGPQHAAKCPISPENFTGVVYYDSSRRALTAMAANKARTAFAYINAGRQ